MRWASGGREAGKGRRSDSEMIKEGEMVKIKTK